jgi:acetolactate synthase I/II/III large subunit
MGPSHSAGLTESGTGAEAALRTAAAAGVEVCFANPGTTELAFVRALERVEAIRPVLVLFEGVAAGAADGYARMMDRPALTLLHQGPSLCYALANLHNARRAQSAVVNIVGDQPTWHASADPPLKMDIEQLARSVGWVRRATSAPELSECMAEALAVACDPPNQVATLVAPADTQWEPAPRFAPPRKPRSPAAPDDGTIREAASLIRTAGSSLALLLGGRALRNRGLRAAKAIGETFGCRLLSESFPSRLEGGGDLPSLGRVAYTPRLARIALGAVQHLLLMGARPPVSFFGYPGEAGPMVPDTTRIHSVVAPDEDAERAVEALADELGARASISPPSEPRTIPVGPRFSMSGIAARLAFHLAEGAIVVDEAVSAAGALLPFGPSMRRFSYLTLTGGALGQGIPCALGAALACPERRVIALVGDGASLYTMQGLWTLARTGSSVMILLVSNGAYQILRSELLRTFEAEMGPVGTALTSLTGPRLDWVQLARGLGLEGHRVETYEDLDRRLEAAMARRGPVLLELIVS